MVALSYRNQDIELPFTLPAGVTPENISVLCFAYAPTNHSDPEMETELEVEAVAPAAYFCRGFGNLSSHGNDSDREEAHSDAKVRTLLMDMVVITQPELYGIDLGQFKPGEQELFQVAAIIRRELALELDANWHVHPVEKLTNLGFPTDPVTGLPLSCSLQRATDDILVIRVARTSEETGEDYGEYHAFVLHAAFPNLELKT